MSGQRKRLSIRNLDKILETDTPLSQLIHPVSVSEDKDWYHIDFESDPEPLRPKDKGRWRFRVRRWGGVKGWRAELWNRDYGDRPIYDEFLTEEVIVPDKVLNWVTINVMMWRGLVNIKADTKGIGFE